MLKSKKGAGTGLWIFFAVLFVVVIALAFIFAPTIRQGLVGEEEEITKEEEEIQTKQRCPDTLKNGKFKVYDSEASTVKQLAGTLYVYEFDENAYNNQGEMIESVTIDADGWDASSNGLCGKYIATFPTTTGGGEANASAVSAPFSVYGDNTKVKLYSNTIDYAETRVKYIDTDAWAYQCLDDTTDGTSGNLTSFSRLNTTHVYTDSSQTAKAVGSNGDLNLLIQIQAATAFEYLHEVDPDLDFWLCVDIGTSNNWQEPTITYNGVTLTDKKSELTANDQLNTKVSASEYCYKLDGKFSSGIQSIYADFVTATDQDPATGDSPIFHFLAEGRFKSVDMDTPDKTLIGVADDSSSRTLVSSPTTHVPSLEIEVS